MLIPLVWFPVILDKVNLRQSKAQDGFFSSYPTSDFLSHYTSLWADAATTVSEVLLLTLHIRFLPSRRFLILFKAKNSYVFPDDLQSSLTWIFEAPHLAMSENSFEFSVLSTEPFKYSFGSSNYKSCLKHLHLRESLPLASLHFISFFA